MSYMRHGIVMSISLLHEIMELKQKDSSVNEVISFPVVVFLHVTEMVKREL